MVALCPTRNSFALGEIVMIVMVDPDALSEGSKRQISMRSVNRWRREEETNKLAILERWKEQAALDAHAHLTGRHTPSRPELRAGNTEREDYTYNRTG